MRGYDPKEWGKDNTYHFDEAAKVWLNLSTCSKDWLKERKRLIEKEFIPFFGKQDIREIKTIRVDQFRKALQDRGVSDKYVKNVMGELRAFFRFHRKSIPELPEIRKVEVQPKVINWLSSEEQDAIFEFIPGKHIRIFEFLRGYGTRLNEACGLKPDTVFLDSEIPYFVLVNTIDKSGNLKERTKTKRVRVLPIVPELAWIFETEPRATFEFERDGGKCYTSKAISRIWERASKKANKAYGVQILNAYNSLRHSWASQRLNEGFPLEEISAVLGHSSFEMTRKVYAQYRPERLMSVIKGRGVHRMFIGVNNEGEQVKLLQGKRNFRNGMVGGTGIEPATSGL